ncbi:hypothetical protein SAMN05192533_106160 [Mesobacillus persicus]|uniref:Sporulation and spore germination n=1 Tax=Mesobacillus persicus TaxID=930146 RepID=A0A1H8BU08_9BACI|nr:hypothetical protein [Mesobacillus persicus]SEM86242.1 hypothetical protein SAMN05192533_106160 [Mesobacillus persicus]
MRKRKLNDRELEELLRQLPKVSDPRHPSEIYQGLSLKKKKKRIPVWVIPGLATGAVLVLLFILSPTLTSWDNVANNSDHAELSVESTESPQESSRAADNADSNAMSPFSTEESLDNTIEETLTANEYEEPTAVYPDDLENNQIFTFSIPDPNAQLIVPVTVLVDKIEQKTWFDLYEETMVKLDEEEWGLSEYFPLEASMSYDEGNQSVNVDVAANHTYGYGSTAETIFTSILKESFPVEKVKKVTFTTDGQRGIELGNYGTISELQTEEGANQAYFFFYSGKEDRPYLVPSAEHFGTISEAFAKMRVDQEVLGLKASLPKDLVLEKSDGEGSGKTLYLKVSEDFSMDDDFLDSLEAIFLTARNFGYDFIRFENGNTEHVGPFDLSKELPLPVAPNKKMIELN